MNKSEIFKAAHKATKAALKAGDSYVVTFASALKGVYMRELTGGKIPTGMSAGRHDSWKMTYVFQINDMPSKTEFARIETEYNQPFALVVLGKKIAEFSDLKVARTAVDAEFKKFCDEFWPEIAAREAARLEKQAEQDAKHAVDAAKAKELADFLGMPELKGTERQVVWAEQIRSAYLKKASEKEAAKAKKRTAAKWWIENRASL